jgi:glycosyltransferase involved in cell wall biosynthesis
MVATEAWRQTGCAEPFRIIHESNLGTQFARIAGVLAAKHDIVCFVDDDNWIAPNWIATLARVMAEYPDVGVCGGRCKPVFEGHAPEWFASVADAFAVGDQFPSRRILSAHEWSLWGAGLCVRRALILKAFDQGWQPHLSCRAGTQLTSGGDAEICMLVRMAGYTLLYEPDLTFQHFITSSKCNLEYVQDVSRGFGTGSVILFQYAMVVGLAPHNGPLSRIRMKLVSIWMLEIARAAVTYVLSCVQAALSRDKTGYAARMRHLKRGRLEGLMDARKTYSNTLHSIRAIAARLGPEANN